MTEDDGMVDGSFESLVPDPPSFFVGLTEDDGIADCLTDGLTEDDGIADCLTDGLTEDDGIADGLTEDDGFIDGMTVGMTEDDGIADGTALLFVVFFEDMTEDD